MEETTLYRRFFLEPAPTDTVHRRYEALRAVFVEGRPMQEVAEQVGYRYDTLRALVAQFRAQILSGHVPPFS